MLKLDIAAGPQWIELVGGVRVEVLPLTSNVVLAAVGDNPGTDPRTGDGQVLYAKAVARRVIIAWEGVGDEDGTPVEPTPERIEALIDLWPIYAAFSRRYLDAGLHLVAEGNGSAPSPNGTSAGATDTVPPVPSGAPNAPT